MKIEIALNSKSILKAVEQIKNYNKACKKAIPTFLVKCAEWVRNKANENLNMTDIGINVKQEILDGWKPLKATKNKVDKSTKVVLQNESKKATYVEFGVGAVGASSPHPDALENGYDYNISLNDPRLSEADRLKQKRYNAYDKEGTKRNVEYSGETVWYISFKSADDIDIDTAYFDPLTEPKYARRSRKYIRTSGQPAQLFLYNAFQDFIDQEIYAKIWKNLVVTI